MVESVSNESHPYLCLPIAYHMEGFQLKCEMEGGRGREMKRKRERAEEKSGLKRWSRQSRGVRRVAERAKSRFDQGELVQLGG